VNMRDPIVERRMAKFEADCDTGSLLCAIVVMALPVLMYVMFGVVLIRDGYISAGLQCLGVAAAFAVLFYILVFKWDMIGDHARHWEKKMQPEGATACQASGSIQVAAD
jgi:hypothetical protein